MQLTIVAEGLPVTGAGKRTHLGLHEGKVAVGLVPATSDTARWTVQVEVIEREGGRDFRGPAVQGRRGERFVYLTYGVVADDGDYTMRGRAKLMLADCPAGASVTCHVEVTGPDGRLRTAQLRPPLSTWTVD